MHIIVKSYEKDIFFSIENNIHSGESFYVSLGSTSKKEKEIHGYGLYNIYEVIKKYHGKIEYKQEGELVIAEIYFSDIIIS